MWWHFRFNFSLFFRSFRRFMLMLSASNAYVIYYLSVDVIYHCKNSKMSVRDKMKEKKKLNFSAFLNLSFYVLELCQLQLHLFHLFFHFHWNIPISDSISVETAALYAAWKSNHNEERGSQFILHRPPSPKRKKKSVVWHRSSTDSVKILNFYYAIGKFRW